ncbi:glycosyltransferase family 25 protein, partial [Amniculicola lignicola CBS 123094]
IWNIRNRTLGFQKIFAVSMPHRTDKRDYLALMAHVSGLDITAVDGVNGSLMHPHAIPSSFTEGGSGTYGCWRAHLNIYQRMLREQIQSALIFEDDADWDVFLRAQMTEFARGTRYITNSTTPLHSPYGDDWDILTIGHTGVDNKPARDGGYWITENDPTVIAESRRGWSRKPDLTVPALSGPHTRLVHTVRRMTGTASYAISLRGASRVLYDQTMLPNAAAIDVALSNMCRLERWTPNFCIGSYPMLIGRYRAAGPKVKDSD